MNDHLLRELVNELTRIGKTYGQTEQLRDRVAHAINDALMHDSVVYEGDPAYHRGYEQACAGAAQRWREALEHPYPKPGTMNEPFESLYRRTEELRRQLDELKGTPYVALRQELARRKQP